MAQAPFNKKRALFNSKIGLELRKKLVKCYIWSIVYLVLKLGRFRQVRNTLNVLKCVAGEGWGRSVESIV
jgi:hypothetical protein